MLELKRYIKLQTAESSAYMAWQLHPIQKLQIEKSKGAFYSLFPFYFVYVRRSNKLVAISRCLLGVVVLGNMGSNCPDD